MGGASGRGHDGGLPMTTVTFTRAFRYRAGSISAFRRYALTTSGIAEVVSPGGWGSGILLE